MGWANVWTVNVKPHNSSDSQSAVLSTRKTYGDAVASANYALFNYEHILRGGLLSQRSKEMASGIAANLRGTLKNNYATQAVIESLTDDLNYWLSK